MSPSKGSQAGGGFSSEAGRKVMGSLSVGITGGICSGKSIVWKSLCSLLQGSSIFSADECVHSLLSEDQNVMRLVGESFPEALNSQGIPDRNLLREAVFRNTSSRKRLEDILHPEVMRRCREARDASRGIFLAEIPLLFEIDAGAEFDISLAVLSSPSIQIERLKSIRKLPQHVIEGILRAQIPAHQKQEQADLVIWNDGDLEILDAQVKYIACDLLSQCGKEWNGCHG